MRNILRKEMRLSASVLSYFFIFFGLMFLLPGYPVLLGAFFVTLGLFQGFQWAREANDIVFSALLPIAKKDIVKGRFLFVCLIEFCALLLMALSIVLRMTVFDSPAYRTNSLMNANFFALSLAFLIFALFNLIFVGGFFKTAYKIGRHFVVFIIVCFSIIFVSEALHHIPGLERLNSFGFDDIPLQLILLLAGIIIFFVITFFSYKKACRDFEILDL